MKKPLRNENNAGNVRAHQPAHPAPARDQTMNIRLFNAHLPSLPRESRAAAMRALRGKALRLDPTI
ncbi:hypothetical protein JR065_09575 [Xanthomonas sp. AmX2]|uniref:hypothetical protein n=1 Tax=Xanthomonas sp. TaxID=29446 RepID=UPI0019803C8D|nr:hypothetical protein [Xanthomonas sp.]MBN6150590.1 hypothetical protein [Xanthomonas sp.]